MKAFLQLDDDLFEMYMQEAIERRMEVGDILRERLKRSIALDPRTRCMVLDDGRLLQQLEEYLGGGQLKGTADLVNKVSRLAKIKFGEHEFRLTAGQFEELAWRAKKTGRTVDQQMTVIFQRMRETFFTYVP